VLPEGLTTIEERAFYYPSKTITTITIPSTLTYIASDAFANSKNVSINISSVESWCNIIFDNTSSKPSNSKLFLNSELLTELIIPNSIEKINDYAFSGMLDIVSVSLPENLKAIGNSSFSFTGLTSINIPNKVEEIGTKAF